MEDKNLESLFETLMETECTEPAQEPEPETVQDEQPERKRFEVTDLASAEWAIKKIAVYQQKKAEAQKEVSEYIEKIEANLAEKVEEFDDKINFFTSLLRPYAERQIEGTKKRSYKLPSGTLQFGKKTDFSKDETKLLAYCKKDCPEFVKVTETVQWGELKKTLKFTEKGEAITEDGEVLDFIKKTEHDTFTVKVG